MFTSSKQLGFEASVAQLGHGFSVYIWNSDSRKFEHVTGITKLVKGKCLYTHRIDDNKLEIKY